MADYMLSEIAILEPYQNHIKTHRWCGTEAPKNSAAQLPVRSNGSHDLRRLFC